MVAETKQVAGFPHAFGVDVGLQQHAAAKRDVNLEGVDLVGLGLAAVDGFHAGACPRIAHSARRQVSFIIDQGLCAQGINWDCVHCLMLC